MASCNRPSSQFLTSQPLGVQNIHVAMDSDTNPLCLCIRIKASKTGPFHKGCFIHIRKGRCPLCALQAVMLYLSIRGNSGGPLFLLQDGRPLSRALLASWLRQIMVAAGIPGNFSSHSFCIGAATVAAHKGIPDHLIQE